MALSLMLLAACQWNNRWLSGQLHVPMDAQVPADARVTVNLETFDGPDSPIHVVASTTSDASTWPHHFRIALPKHLGQGHRQYIVVAQITSKKGLLLFVNQALTGVDLGRLDQPLDVMMVPVTPAERANQ